jgi:hypothetical protein
MGGDVADCDTIADIDDAGDDLAGDTEAEVGFVARPHHAHEFPRAIHILEADALDLHGTLGLKRRRRIGFAAGEREQRGESEKRTIRLRSRLENNYCPLSADKTPAPFVTGYLHRS